jgi:hypothetical protein
MDSFFDDFPEDMFDNIDPPISPSNKLWILWPLIFTYSVTLSIWLIIVIFYKLWLINVIWNYWYCGTICKTAKNRHCKCICP